MDENILVTCASGSLGTYVMDALISKGIKVDNLFAMVRDPLKLESAALAREGITCRKADMRDLKTVTAAMSDIKILIFISSGTAENRYDQHYNVIKAAKDSGTVRHIIYTSLIKCTISKYMLAADHWKTEDSIKSVGIKYTIFRNTLFMEMIMFMIGDALITGKWQYPGGKAKINFVAQADIADGLAQVICNLKPHVNKIYEITSRKSHNFREIAKILSVVSNTYIVYQPISLEDFKDKLCNDDPDISDFDVAHTGSVIEAILAGQFKSTSVTLDRIIGHKPKTLKECLPSLLKIQEHVEEEETSGLIADPTVDI